MQNQVYQNATPNPAVAPPTTVYPNATSNPAVYPYVAPNSTTVAPPTTVVIAQPRRQIKVENYNTSAVIALGICQIVLGVLMIAFNVSN